MFINKDKQKQEEASQDLSTLTETDQGESKKLFSKEIYAILVVVILGLAIIFYLMYFKKPQPGPIGPLTNQDNQDSGESGPVSLPGGLTGDGDTQGNGVIGDDLKAENLTYAQFYQKIEDSDFKPQLESLDLPINVKTDVANYHDISRKVNLELYIDEINNNGFAVINNQFPGQTDDFYSAYSFLSEKEIPIILTSDFLIYYFQNTLKEIFKEIEKDVFYKDLWDINKEFYKMADGKYRERQKRVGMVNDPILEGLRLEAAYFAVALELLKPKADQITPEVVKSDDTKFTSGEIVDFEFNLTDYLEEDVAREVDLITKGQNLTKSPVLLYERDYKEFIVPDEYKSYAKLNNYYLASKWLNSVFPLYYQDDDCAGCLLDKDDWLINMITACSIANDFSRAQELKNKWAKIYKVISFFKGLRRDLTYLHYQDSLVSLFGNDYKIEEIFSLDNPLRDDNLISLQDKIAEYNFPEIEGSIERNDDASMPNLGLRVLQESYWPNDYIFRQLTYPNVTEYSDDEKILKGRPSLISMCLKETLNNRCQGIGLDVVNLIYQLPESNKYFQENTNYQNYNSQANLLRSQLNDFNLDSWHNNSYWVTLDIANVFLNSTSLARPNFSNSSWQERNINTVLGSWVNLQLPADKLIGGWQEEGGSLAISTTGSDYDYIEPDLVLINELIANTKMLSQMLISLNVVKDYKFSKLNVLTEELTSIKNVIKKELTSEVVNFDDIEVINNLVKQFKVAEPGNKSINLNFKNSHRVIAESIDGIKLLIIVYRRDDIKIFAIGPIFNYQEQ